MVLSSLCILYSVINIIQASFCLCAFFSCSHILVVAFSKLNWIRDTDSKYIQLAKKGGRKDLLTFNAQVNGRYFNDELFSSLLIDIISMYSK